MSSYGIAMIGAGDRGRTYSQALSQTEGVTPVSVFDLDGGRATGFVKSFGYKYACGDYREAIDKDGVNVVVICTPAYYHPEIAIYAMKQGKHVLCEKPIALSLKDAKAMIQTSRECNVKLGVGLQYRNQGNFRKMKAAITEGKLGRPVLMRFSDVRELRPKRAMHDAAQGNGGPLVDMSCHFIDLMYWMFNAEPVRVTARSFTFAADRPEIAHFTHKAPDTAAMIIEYASGDVGEISICWGLPPGVNGEYRYDALGPEGLIQMVNIGGMDRVFCVREGNQATEVLLGEADRKETSNAEGTLVRQFFRAIEGEGEFPTGGPEAAVALATSLAALKSAAEGRPVTISEIMEAEPDVVGSMKK